MKRRHMPDIWGEVFHVSTPIVAGSPDTATPRAEEDTRGVAKPAERTALDAESPSVADSKPCTPDQYAAMSDAQRGACAICFDRAELLVDHCHATGKVRGLLCHHCNVMLGHAKDEPRRLQLAIYYLRESM